LVHNHAAANNLPGDFTVDEDYRNLDRRIGEIRRDADLPDNVFHLAVPPAFFDTIAEKLDAVGLSQGGSGWRRLVIEKPFGEDRDSARELHRRLRAVFDDEQIYRIDHFLGKETVQNMLVFRFANGFEPIWNHRFIDHVQITVAEHLGIGTPEGFPNYAAGSWGPQAASEMLERSGRHWKSS
jgi:glucose-6-phosphate 1-dehydrogenase